jgi:hypothetical protein
MAVDIYTIRAGNWCIFNLACEYWLASILKLTTVNQLSCGMPSSATNSPISIILDELIHYYNTEAMIW